MNNLIGRGHTILVVGIDRKIIGNTSIQCRQFQCRCKDLMRLLKLVGSQAVADNVSLRPFDRRPLQRGQAGILPIPDNLQVIHSSRF